MRTRRGASTTRTASLVFGTRSTARDEAYKEVYSNFAKIGFSPLDLFVTYGKFDTTPELTTSIIDLITIRMSPVQFKLLSGIWQNYLELWEKTFGEINVPANTALDKSIIVATFEAMAEQLREQAEARKKALDTMLSSAS